jgi:hypothetical protein
METLMKSRDRDICSGAAPAVAKLGLSEKSSNEGELLGLLQAACDLLKDQVNTGAAATAESSKKVKSKEFIHI